MGVIRRLVLAALIVLSVAWGPAPALAGDGAGDATTTVAELPPAHIIPRPNSGTPPAEAGDRGGALQLGLLALVVVVIAAAVANLVRQSRRARRRR